MFTLAELEATLPIVRAAMPADTAICVAAAARAHRRDRRGQAREPHADRRLQGARRCRLHRPAQARAAGPQGHHHGDARQSRSIIRIRLRPREHPCTVAVPFGNSTEKNAAMRAFGAELIEHGRDFDEARERAAEIATERGYEYGKSFDKDLLLGVATYAHELFSAEPDLDAVFVPIGLGSGICGVISARDAMGHKAKVVGVMSENANMYRLSLEAGRPVSINSCVTFADGMAVRIPSAEAFEIIRRGADHLVEVSDDEIAEAIRVLIPTRIRSPRAREPPPMRRSPRSANATRASALRWSSQGRTSTGHGWRPCCPAARRRRRDARLRRSDAAGALDRYSARPRKIRSHDQAPRRLFRAIPACAILESFQAIEVSR